MFLTRDKDYHTLRAHHIVTNTHFLNCFRRYETFQDILFSSVKQIFRLHSQ